MAGKRKANVVDGFMVVKSLGQGHPPAHPSSPPPPPPPPPKKEKPKAASGAGRVALPSRHEIACYDCGWESFVLGQQRFAVCPKCRKKIDIVHYTIDNEFNGVIRTAGVVRITANAVISGGEIHASHIVLAGRVEEGLLNALRGLEIEAGGACPESKMRFGELRVGPGARIVFAEPVACRGLEVAGEIEGALSVAGLAAVRATGCLRGTLDCARLVVEDGAGLVARVSVQPARAPAAVATAA